MKLKIPYFSLVLLIGPMSSGKTTFAKRHFKESEIISPGYCRYLISDHENDPSVNTLAQDVMYDIIDKRLKLKKLTVVDATNLLENDRFELLEIARKHHAISIAIVFNLPEQVYFRRNDHHLDVELIKYQINQLQYALMSFRKEGLNNVYVFNSLEEVNHARIYINPLNSDKSNEKGPFDIIGDVHGCYDELVLLLKKLKYEIDGYKVTHKDNRKVLFLGDLVDRGPKIVQVLELVMSMTSSGIALCVQGNHDNKLYRKLNGKNVQVKNGLEDSLEQIEPMDDKFKEDVKNFLKYLETHYVFDEGKLVISHAGMKEEYIGRYSKAVQSFALYGETTGETDEFGLPIRKIWAKDYRGKALVLYGHTPNLEVFELNHTINIDTGCVFGNKLTCYRYPEGDYVQVNALKTYSESSRPIK